MIKKITRPKCLEPGALNYGGVAYLLEQVDLWFRSEVEPINRMLDDAVEVYGCHRDYWTRSVTEQDTHRALLVGIEKIQPETCADVLREIVAAGNFMHEHSSLWHRAKAALKNEIDSDE